MPEKLSHEEFVIKAIVSLRKEGFTGMHAEYSGFNEAFKKYREGEDPVEVTNRFAQQGKIVSRPIKGGVMLYPPEESPGGRKADEAPRAMGLR